MDPMTSRVKVIKTNNYVFQVKVILNLESTCLDGRRPVRLEKLKLKVTEPSLSLGWS